MAEFKKMIVTKKGQALMMKMIAGQEGINFTKVDASETAYTDEQLEELTFLTGVKQTTLVSKVIRTNNVAIQVEAAMTNTELITGYYMKTLGLYAIDPDDGEILYGVSNASVPGWMPAYNSITVSGAYIKLITTVGNADNVSLDVDPAAVATVGDLLRKVDTDGGDVSNTVITNIIEPEEDFPLPAVNQPTKNFMGSVVKCLRDFITLKPNIITNDKLKNNGTTTADGFALDARMGKSFADQFDVLNSNVGNLKVMRDGTDIRLSDGGSGYGEFIRFRVWNAEVIMAKVSFTTPSGIGGLTVINITNSYEFPGPDKPIPIHVFAPGVSLDSGEPYVFDDFVLGADQISRYNQTVTIPKNTKLEFTATWINTVSVKEG